MLIDLILPVYNNPQYVVRLLDSINRANNYENSEVALGKVIIGDDCSRPATIKLLENAGSLYPNLDIEVIFNQQNKGYGANCNNLFACTTSELVVVLNSDIILPNKWLERMVVPFLNDSNVVLSTPFATDGANYTIAMSEGQSWLELDNSVKNITPQHPSVCTAIGYLMAVRKSFFEEFNQPLYDEVYKRGYCEDTDLHYRVVTQGKKSVLIDNMIIYHTGGGSFSQLEDLSAIQQVNREIFLKRWGEAHEKDLRSIDQLYVSNYLNTIRCPENFTLLNTPKRELDVLFVVPSIHQRYGGVRMITEFVNYIIDEGVKTAIFSQHKDYSIEDAKALNNSPYFNFETLYEKVSNIKKIFITSVGTIADVYRIKEQYPHAEIYYFYQGPEHLFLGGIHTAISLDLYNKIENVVCGSDYLEEYLGNYPNITNLNNIKLAPDGLYFYPTSIEREKKSIAIPLNKDDNKGSAYSLELGYLLYQQGYKIYFFGHDTVEFKGLKIMGTVLGKQSPEELAELFNKVEYLIDCSLFEGLGLIAMEAAYCGAIPIILHNGGADGVFTHKDNAIFIEDRLNLQAASKEITSISDEDKQKLSANAKKIFHKYNKKSAFSKFLEIIQ